MLEYFPVIMIVRSPDLTPNDFFLWVTLSLTDLRTSTPSCKRLQEESAAIPLDITQRVITVLEVEFKHVLSIMGTVTT